MGQLVTDHQFLQLIKESRENKRKRSHLLLHESANDPIQSLLFALQPGTVIQPHRHEAPTETLCCFQGEIAVFFYSEAGEILNAELINEQRKIFRFNPSLWHSYMCLQEDTIGWEIKEGPFNPENIETPAWYTEKDEQLLKQKLHEYIERRFANE